MIFQYFVIFVLLLAMLLQIAVDRAPDIPESHDNMAARKVLIVGIFVLIVYLCRLCWIGIDAQEVLLIGLFFVALSEVAFCVNRLFPTVFVHVSERFRHIGE